MSAFRGELNRIGQDDMITLSSSDDNAIVDNLKKRLKGSIIYTAIGSVQISVNPFKELSVIDSAAGRQLLALARTFPLCVSQSINCFDRFLFC